jgi:hypothetical protein
MNKEQIAKIAGEAGAKAALEAWDKKWNEQKKTQYTTRLWNTRMLLKHYTSLKEYCEKAIYSRSSIDSSEKPVEILESLGECSKEEYIESIKSSTIRTMTIMAHVEAMLKLYKIYCETSGKVEDERRYRILHANYFEKVKIADICEAENIDRSTYYRDNRESSEMLSALIFGADGLSAMRQRGN